MKSLVAFAAILAAGAVAAPAFAQAAALTLPALSPITLNGSAGFSGIDTLGADPTEATLRFGADFGKYVGVEAEGSFGLNHQDGRLGAVSASLHYDDQYAAYAVARWPVLANANLFARAGFGHSDIRVLPNADPLPTSSYLIGEDSINYGAGGEYFFTANDGVRVDYTRFDFRDRGVDSANTWSVSYVRKF
jgi:hypothetical protein